MFRSLAVACCCTAALLCSACATTTAGDAKAADASSPKIYRTGSNIAVRDYDARDITLIDPETLSRLPPPAARVPRGPQ